MPNDPLPIPEPPVIRQMLARNVREARLLRSLLRLSVRAAEDRRQVAELAAPIIPREPSSHSAGR